MVLKIVWRETHGHSINGERTIILFSNPYKICQTTKLKSLPINHVHSNIVHTYIIQPLLNFLLYLAMYQQQSVILKSGNPAAQKVQQRSSKD